MNILNVKKTYKVLVYLSLILFSAFLASFQQKKIKPTLFLIGDSTVKCGKGNGEGGLWGWGSFIGEHFDTSKINIENYALGGRSSRTFQTEGHWEKVLQKVKAGDFLIMQFGHNDNWPLDDTLRARGSIKGIGEEFQEIYNPITHKQETVYTYGWYLRKLVKDAKEKGVDVLIASPVLQNKWDNGKVHRTFVEYSDWAAQVAKAEKVYFVPLNELIAEAYNKAGEAKVRSIYFNDTDRTHTILDGAKANAACVVAGLSDYKPLRKYFRN